MPEPINRRCPQCGRKAHDRLLVQCPDCHVPFEVEAAYAGLTPDQLRLAIGQVLRSWKLWAFLVLFVGIAAWGVVIVADRLIDARAQTYLKKLEETATNHLGFVAGQISNQIVTEFKQPRMRSIIDDAAREKAMQMFSDSVKPSLDDFQDAMDLAKARLAGDLGKSSNLVAQLNADVLAAERNLAQSTSAVAVVPKPAAPKPASTNDDSLHLTLGNHTLTQTGSSYFLTLYLNNNSSTTSGTAYVMAGVYQQTAKILNFSSANSRAVNPPSFSDMRDVAKLRFNVPAGVNPTLVLELDGPTIVRLISDSLDADITLPVAADKMQLPHASK